MVRQARLMSHAWTGEAGQRADARGGTLAGLAQGLARTESQVAQPTPPHPSHPRPSLGAGTALGKYPPLKNFLLKSNPSSNNLLGTLQRYGTLFERGVAWTLSRYPPL
jgi:hypothetical protein